MAALISIATAGTAQSAEILGDPVTHNWSGKKEQVMLGSNTVATKDNAVCAITSFKSKELNDVIATRNRVDGLLTVAGGKETEFNEGDWVISVSSASHMQDLVVTCWPFRTISPVIRSDHAVIATGKREAMIIGTSTNPGTLVFRGGHSATHVVTVNSGFVAGIVNRTGSKVFCTASSAGTAYGGPRPGADNVNGVIDIAVSNAEVIWEGHEATSGGVNLKFKVSVQGVHDFLLRNISYSCVVAA